MAMTQAAYVHWDDHHEVTKTPSFGSFLRLRFGVGLPG